ncbi:MAG: hypothetical protein IKH61_02620 [Bacteroidales bacterium]|nr:hypothetical protein [Bacteroidales bacterium]MBR6929104.1 hypothetical protein [Bacteroidales bacterium]
MEDLFNNKNCNQRLATACHWKGAGWRLSMWENGFEGFAGFVTKKRNN